MPTSVPDPGAKNPNASRHSVPRGGFVIHRRGSSRGDLISRIRPSEHDSLESAKAEAARLAERFDREFVVFQEVASVVPAAADAKAA